MALPNTSNPCALQGTREGSLMLILVAVIPVLIALSSAGMLVESLSADDLSRMGVVVEAE